MMQWFGQGGLHPRSLTRRQNDRCCFHVLFISRTYRKNQPFACLCGGSGEITADGESGGLS
jgi:hypothetical protein